MWLQPSRPAAVGRLPGHLPQRYPPGKSARAVRLRVDERPIRFQDRIQGPKCENLAETSGDFVIWRADDLPAYQLAVVTDDVFQGVNEVVRGYDLIGSTARQIHVAHCLGLPVPAYAHHPVVVSPDRQKLSKRLSSDPIVSEPRAQTLARALRFLGQPCPDNLPFQALWSWAVNNWRLDRVPAVPRAEA